MMQYTAEQIAAYKKRKKLEMTKRRFFYCVGRRVNYDWRPMVAYLDVQTGKILYVFRESTHATVDGSESAEDNEAKKSLVASDLSRFRELPVPSPEEYTDIIKKYVKSNYQGIYNSRPQLIPLITPVDARVMRRKSDDENFLEFVKFYSARVRRVVAKYVRENGDSHNTPLPEIHHVEKRWRTI